MFSVYMTPGRLSRRREFTPVPSHLNLPWLYICFFIQTLLTTEITSQYKEHRWNYKEPQILGGNPKLPISLRYIQKNSKLYTQKFKNELKHDSTTKCYTGASHPGFCIGARITLRYEISQRYHVNEKRPPVSVLNRSAGVNCRWTRTGSVCVMFAILNRTCILSR